MLTPIYNFPLKLNRIQSRTDVIQLIRSHLPNIHQKRLLYLPALYEREKQQQQKYQREIREEKKNLAYIQVKRRNISVFHRVC